MPLDDVATTVITYEEQTRGWLARLARQSTLEQQILDYAEVKKLFRDYCYLAVLDFDVKATAELRKLQSAKIRVGTMDLKIASIALAQNAVLLTRNTRHFSRVPGLLIEDWSF